AMMCCRRAIMKRGITFICWPWAKSTHMPISHNADEYTSCVVGTFRNDAANTTCPDHCYRQHGPFLSRRWREKLGFDFWFGAEKTLVSQLRPRPTQRLRGRQAQTLYAQELANHLFDFGVRVHDKVSAGIGKLRTVPVADMSCCQEANDRCA